ncbi:hypothetical protein HMPREF2719_21570 [Pseudomonas aeruginosa]|uniref:hypothetical protein n=1 Tax=Pseudomonas aeruginosa TaxID=287 RepID=UPI0008A8AB56|nr:hypothetical protein [Pseudomonas aeruginosa]EKV3033121.1 hypothetical protein [Pseudomonas aeruginosa]EKV3075301.1 hypothetical protein [Pseudomonas aeruginosa]OHP42032.1 hypothetical protein HMPREF2719_21570 [Pseudomonas aeruginosa]HCF7735179.1 hypothetical protein [Pseudomonas aeruginosa]
MSADKPLVAALQALWDIPPPGPQNLWSSREFVALKEVLVKLYRNGKATFALEVPIGNALRSLGWPCSTPHLPNQPRPDLDQVAAALAHEFQRTTTRRRHLCPLDMADELPTFQFGNAKMGRFTAAELEDLFDAPRLERCYPGIRLDARNLSQFHWLVVEEDVSVRSESGNRQFSLLDLPFGKDLGEVVPHSGRFPAVVERALFFLLLAPWEDWSEMPEVDWRGFRVPWIYSLDDDLCAFPTPPPAPERLSWQPHFQQVAPDEWEESERPAELKTSASAEDVRQALDSEWPSFQTPSTLASELFSTPVEHFLVRAFLSDGIDEVMAHLIVVEAAFGSESDHKAKQRLPTDSHKEGATRRVAARLSAAIGRPEAAKEYLDLYDMRCTYVHGRPEGRIISTKQRVLARRLAREAANALVGLAQDARQPREEILLDLLNRGVANLPKR